MDGVDIEYQLRPVAPQALQGCAVMEQIDQGVVMTSSLTLAVAAKVRELRLHRRLTVQQVADRCERAGVGSLNRVTLAKIETKRRRFITVEELEALATAFDTFPDELLGESAGRVGSSRIWNTGPREPMFTGRSELLEQVAHGLSSSRVVALFGLIGAGKSTLALEYAYRNASAYDIVWWVDASDATTISQQLSSLSTAAGWIAPNAEPRDATRATWSRLRQADRWLVIFDSAQLPAEFLGEIPDDTGHVLVTSRDPQWTNRMQAYQVPEFPRRDSIEYVIGRLPSTGVRAAEHLARHVGDLPLGLATAVKDIKVGRDSALAPNDGQSDIGDAIDLITASTVDLRPLPLIEEADRLRWGDQALLQLLQALSVMAADAVPMDLLRPTEDTVVNGRIDDTEALDEIRAAVDQLVRRGLATEGPTGLTVHRLTAATVRNQLDATELMHARETAGLLLASIAPTDSDDPTRFDDWRRIMPHVRAVDLVGLYHQDIRAFAADAVSFLLNSGDVDSACDLAERLHTEWLARHGEDHSTLRMGRYLARAYLLVGRNEEAHRTAESAYRGYQRREGDDHELTLAAATGLGAALRALGQPDKALEVDRSTLDRKRRRLGPDHPSTLLTATNYAMDLRSIGQNGEALALDQETWAARKRIHGDDHPSTLISATNLASDLRQLGRLTEAVVLQRETLAHRHRVQGPTHPDTIALTEVLVADLRALGLTEEADALLAEESWAAGNEQEQPDPKEGQPNAGR